MKSFNALGSMLAVAVSLGAVATVVACSSDSERQCRIGADCASGVCNADGTCQPNSGSSGGADAAGTDATTADGSAPVDAGKDVVVSSCVPNKDGMITRDEAPAAAGLHATYKIASDVDISTAGTGTGSARVWDYTAALSSDSSVIVETLPLAGKWFETKYPGATYATKLSNSSDLLGIFEYGTGALLLRGVVSPTDGTSKTELQYAPSSSVLDFPLTVGKTWTSAVKVSGTAQGVALFGTYDETYVNKVDAAGTLKTPLGTFDVMRVQVVLTRQIGILPATTVRTFAFVTECYGTIATITSADNDTNVEFTHAAEIRRVAP